MTTPPTSKGPLAGVRVLDLTDERAIFGAKLLADLGAETTRVEPPAGDPLRRRLPIVDAGGEPVSLWHTYYTTHRTCVTADCATEEGRDRIRALALASDVVVECGALDAAEVTPAGLLAQRPDLLVVRVSSFGREGPWRDYLAPDLVAGALGGVCATTGDADTPPLKGHGDVHFLVSGAYAAIGALAALRRARETGIGQVVELSVHEALASCLENVFLRYWYHERLGDSFGAVRPRRGSLHSTGYFEVMRARGGSVLVTSAPDPNLQLAWLAEEGAEADLLDERYQQVRNPQEFYRPLFAALRRWVADKDADALFLEAQARHLAYGKVATVPEVAANPQLAARDWWVEYPLPSGSVRGPGAPLRFSESPWQPPGAISSAPEREASQPDDVAPSTAAGHPSASHGAQAALPLAGLRVLDFTHVVAGPFGTRILGDLGADVVKVHSAARNSGARAVDNPAYLMWNRNKRALALNMGTSEGRAVCRRLAERAEVVIENFSPDVLERWGIGYDAVRPRNPSVIYVSLPGMGAEGPWSRFVTYAPAIHALCGLTALTGPPDRDGFGIGFSYNDHQAGLQAVVAVLAALEARRRSGRGQRIEVAQFEVGVHLIAPALLDYAASGHVAGPSGNQPPFGAAAPHDCYPCLGEDRWVAIAVTKESQWQRLRGVMGDPAWARDAALQSAAGRVARMEQVDAGVAAWTRSLDAYEVQGRCQAAGVPAGVVQTGLDLAEHDPQLRQARFLFPLSEQHPLAGTVYADRLPLHFSAAPDTPYRRPRTLGEDNAAVLADWLGMEDAEVRAGEAAGIFR